MSCTVSLSIIANAVVSLSVISGANGDSAYQIAVANGYEGTVDQWLASLGVNLLVAQSLTPAQQAQLQSNAALLPGINFPALAGNITALVGGGANHLDGIPTTGASLTNAITATGMIPQGFALMIFPAGGVGAEIWRWLPTTATSNGPGLVLSTDWNASTNANAWQIQS